MKHLYIILITTLLLSACADDRRVVSLLDHAQTLMDSLPDSAHTLLMEADSLIPRQSEKTRMRHAFLMAEASNKLYLPLPSDTIFSEVVDYYDHHGTPNQQLLAHYLLGCIYRDQGEAPMALQCFEDAVEKADTLSEDCDYMTLYKVYGQMADVFESQIMPDEEIEALKQYRKYALKAGNIFEYIHGLECQVFPYDQKRDTAMILSTEKQAYELYIKYGFPHAAASAYTTSVYVYLARGNNAKAHELMEMFEKESGLFDANGDICEGREHYYYSKGLYYTNIHQLDSAEFYFRKLLKYGYSFDAYNGLITISKQRGDAPSTLLYMEHYEAAFDTLITNIHAQATRQALGMYNYSRHQKIAAQKTTEAHQREKELHITFIIFILVGGIFYHLYAKIKAKRKAEVQLLNQQLVHVSALYRKTQEELDSIDENVATYKEKKQKELNDLQQQLVQLQEEYGAYKQNEKYEVLAQSPIMATIKERLKPTTKSNCLTEKEWRLLSDAFKQNMPLLSFYMEDKNTLSSLELRIVILTRLKFRSDDIALLLNIPKQSVSNAKANANKKLFSDNSARTLYKNLSKI